MLFLPPPFFTHLPVSQVQKYSSDILIQNQKPHVIQPLPVVSFVSA